MPLVDHVDPLAKQIGAINTIVVEADGSLRGFNNDGNGFVQSIRDAKPDWRPDAGPIAVIGAGGAARAVVASLAAQGAREIRVVNRTHARAQELETLLGPPVHAVRWEQRTEALEGIALLANATNQGMAGKPPLDLALDRLPAHAIVGDLIYTPPVTPLLAAARARGNLTVNGLGLLLNQARPAFHAWFGVMPDITPELIRAIEATF
jgi:shikimate dehydrogenase